MASNDEDYHPSEDHEQQRKPKGNLTNGQRMAVVQALLRNCNENHRLKHGSINEIAKTFGVHRQTVRLIWKRGLESLEQGSLMMDASHRKAVSGRKAVSLTHLFDALKTIPLSKRGTQRSAAKAIGVSVSTLNRRIKKGEVKVFNSSLKPTLSQENQERRKSFCLSFLKLQENEFDDMKNVIHVDEKWFYLTKNKKKFYLSPDESNPHRTTKNKRYIPKVMFLAAVARPRWDSKKNCLFDGKIGIWPFAETGVAMRTSRHRVKGTPITKVVNVGKKEYREFLIKKLLPAIAEKWPAKNETIFIQQDNSPVHIDNDDPEYAAAVAAIGMDVRLYYQPPNSPDLNVLDLGFFTAIQSLQHQTETKTIDDLIAAVLQAFAELEHSKLDDIFLTLQKVMECIILHSGNNNFAIPHSGKKKLEQLGELRLPSIVIGDALRAVLTMAAVGSVVQDLEELRI